MSRPKKSAAARGLGWQHQQTRKTLLARHTDGSPCWWCGQPMYRDKTKNFDYNPASLDPGNGALAADHTRARAHGGTKADRLLHGLCNKERGDGSRDHLRPVLHGGRHPDPVNALGAQAMHWPI